MALGRKKEQTAVEAISEAPKGWQPSNRVKQELAAYQSDYRRWRAEEDRIAELYKKADEMEDQVDDLAGELHAAEVHLRNLKEEYHRTNDLDAVAAAQAKVRDLQERLAIVKDLAPVARRGAEEARRRQNPVPHEPPYSVIAEDIFLSLGPDLGFALWCWKKAHGNIGSGGGPRFINTIHPQLVKDDECRARFNSMTAESDASA